MGAYLDFGAVKLVLRKYVDSYWAVGQTPRYAGFADQQYYLPSQGEIGALLRDIPRQPLGFFGEVFDCDDYAFVMKGAVSIYARDTLRVQAGPCIGIAWGRFAWKPEPFHACNWAIDDQHNFSWLEPQDRTVHKPTECFGGLTLLIV
jgi:hypothetical protein